MHLSSDGVCARVVEMVFHGKGGALLVKRAYDGVRTESDSELGKCHGADAAVRSAKLIVLQLPLTGPSSRCPSSKR